MQFSNDIIFERLSGNKGDLGLVTLNRPQALNAITHNMTVLLYEQLKAWQIDTEIKAVVIQGSGERAFCAGGDLRNLYIAKQNKDKSITEFFWYEYRLNHLIKHYSKPYIAFMDGITMGGGVGLSEHGSHRIGTERLLFAMPETNIGFFPDVGGSYFLSRCPGELGIYLGLTGTQLNTAEALYLNFIDYYIPVKNFTLIIQALRDTDIAPSANLLIHQLLKTFAEKTAPPVLQAQEKIINDCFQFDNIENIFQALSNQADPFSKSVLKNLKTKSPTALKVTLEELRRGKQLSFEACMQMEFRLVNHFLDSSDFFEGIRSIIIDKDQKPVWQPARLEDVSYENVLQYFSPLKNQELHFN